MCMFVNVFQEDIIISWKHWGMGYRSMVEYLVCVKSWAQLVYLLRRNTVYFSIFYKSLPQIFLLKWLLHSSIFLLLFICFSLCVCLGRWACEYRCSVSSQMPHPPGGGAGGSCESSDTAAGSSTQVLHKQYVLLTAGWSLWLSHIFDQLGTDIILSWLSVQLTVKLLLNSDRLFLVAPLYNYWIVPLDWKAVTKYTCI